MKLLYPLWRPLGALGLGLCPLLTQAGQTNVGVSVEIQQPGVYGRVQIGDAPPPVIYQQPVIIEHRPVAVVQRPIYLRVPPGHERQWARYCGRYQACGQPVYFVRPEPRVREDKHHDHDDDHKKGGHGHGHGHDRH